MSEGRRIRIFRSGQNQVIRIPQDFELPGDEAITRRDGARLVIEPVPVTTFRELLAQWPPLAVGFPDIDDLPPDSVEL